MHELVREVLYDDLAPASFLELHLAIGTVLERLYRNDLGHRLSEIAHHLALARPWVTPAAVDYLVEAGDRAAGLFAYEEAGLHYERALGLVGAAEVPRATTAALLLRLGDARWRAGDTRRAGQLRGGGRACAPPRRR